MSNAAALPGVESHESRSDDEDSSSSLASSGDDQSVATQSLSTSRSTHNECAPESSHGLETDTSVSNSNHPGAQEHTSTVSAEESTSPPASRQKKRRAKQFLKDDDGKPYGLLQVKWDEMFDRLVKYKLKHGDCLVPNRYKGDSSLGAWVSTQRRQYKILTTGSYESTPMTPDRAQRLESLGFVWATKDPRHVPWARRFQELVEFKKQYGHCSVPIGYERNIKLANWVSTQRQEAKLFREGRSSRLDASKVAALDNIGFIWKAPRGISNRVNRISAKEDEDARRTTNYHRENQILSQQHLSQFNNGDAWLATQAPTSNSHFKSILATHNSLNSARAPGIGPDAFSQLQREALLNDPSLAAYLGRNPLPSSLTSAPLLHGSNSDASILLQRLASYQRNLIASPLNQFPLSVQSAGLRYGVANDHTDNLAAQTFARTGLLNSSWTQRGSNIHPLANRATAQPQHETAILDYFLASSLRQRQRSQLPPVGQALSGDSTTNNADMALLLLLQQHQDHQSLRPSLLSGIGNEMFLNSLAHSTTTQLGGETGEVINQLIGNRMLNDVHNMRQQAANAKADAIRKATM